MKFKFLFLLMFLFSFSFVVGEAFGYGETEETPINYSTIPTVNNSDYLDGQDGVYYEKLTEGEVENYIENGDVDLNGDISTDNLLFDSNNNIRIGHRDMLFNPTSSVYIGYNSGSLSSSDGNVAIGTNSGHFNNQNYGTCIGYACGYSNRAITSTGLGAHSSSYNTGDYGLFIGSRSGNYNSGDNSIAIGKDSLYKNTGNNVIGIGTEAGSYNNLDYQFFIESRDVSDIPLIQGNFLNKTVDFYGDVFVNGGNLGTSETLYYGGGSLGSSLHLFGEGERELSVELFYANKVNNSAYDIAVTGEYTGETDRDYLINISKIDNVSAYNDVGCLSLNENVTDCTYFSWSNDNGSTWEEIDIITEDGYYILEDGIRFSFRFSNTYIQNFSLGDTFTFSAFTNPKSEFKVDTKNSIITSEASLFNITGNVDFGGSVTGTGTGAEFFKNAGLGDNPKLAFSGFGSSWGPGVPAYYKKWTGTMQIDGYGRLKFDGAFSTLFSNSLTCDAGFSIGANGALVLDRGIRYTTSDYGIITSKTTGTYGKNALRFMDSTDKYSNMGEVNYDNPTFFVHADGATSANAQYISLSHDGTNGVIESGTGTTSFNDDNIITESNITADTYFSGSNEGFTGSCINVTYYGGIAISCND